MQAEEGSEGSEAGEEVSCCWPPVRRVGSFDPFTDDPRLAVKTVTLCRNTGAVLVGGMAGQLLLCSLAPHKTVSAIIVQGCFCPASVPDYFTACS